MVQLHIILDIDQTMIDSMRQEVYEEKKMKLRKPDNFCRDNGLVVWERQHLKKFLNYLDRNVRYISIWTNGSRGWLNYVLYNILSKYIKPQRFLHLVSVDFSDKKFITNLNQVVLVKDINKLLMKFPKRDVSLKNTVLIDDNLFNCYYNKNNTLPIKKFSIELEKTELKRGMALNYLIDIIKTLKNTQDVSITLSKVYGDMDNYDKLFG